MSTFSAPLRVRGPTQDGDQAPNVDAGDVIASQTATMIFSDTEKALFSIPGNSQIIDFNIDVTTAFDAGTNNFLDLGITGDLARFTDDASLAAIARVLGSADVSQLVNYADVGTEAE